MFLNKVMKRTIDAVLIGGLALSLAACGSSSSGTTAAAPVETKAAETKAAETTAAPAESKAEETQAAAEGSKDYTELFKKNIEIICPWAAGGGADGNSRQIGAVMAEKTGRTVTVTNQTGGSGAVGFSAIMTADPDGNTIGIITAEINTLPPQGLVTFTYADMYPLIRLCTLPSVVAVKADSPFQTLDELVAFAKENPGKLKVGTVGTGSIWHIQAAKFMKVAGIELTTVPYDGAATAATAMLAGEIDLTTTELSVAHAYVQSGDMRILGTMTEERLADYGDYPTCRELGYDCVGGSFQGMFCPNGVDDETKANLEALLTDCYNSDAYQTYCKNAGMVPAYLDHEGWEAFLKEDLETTTALMKDLGLAK